MRRFSLASLAVATMLIALPSGASGATQIGQTFEPTDNCSPRVRLQSSSPGGQYAAPFAGVITSWNFQASSGGSSSGSPVSFKVGRHAGGDQFTIVGESEGQNIPDLDVFMTFPTRIPVLAGDVIGLFTAPASVFYCARPAPGYLVHLGPFGSDVAPGATETFTPADGLQLDVSAALEPDCDNDGFGDETQDSSLPTPPCPTPLTCKGQQLTDVGTDGPDEIVGTPERDVISALGGKDEVSGFGGKDLICGGKGKDTLRGGKSKDKLYGQAGKDKLRGGGGKDRCVGGKKDDSAKKCEFEKSI